MIRKLSPIFVSLLLLFSTSAVANSIYIDNDVDQAEYIKRYAKYADSSVYHLFSHAKPGQLLIKGYWIKEQDLINFISSQINSNTTHINIYGCEFAKGSIGKRAVDLIQKSLNITVSASNDITGIDGDWELEVGIHKSFSNLKTYNYNLQCPGGIEGGIGDNDDYDGDGVCNNIDVDDDNDGILDVDECANLGATCSEDAVLFSAGDVYEVDLNTGVTNQVGTVKSIAGADLPEFNAVAYNECDNTYWGTTGANFGGRFYQVDPSIGTADPWQADLLIDDNIGTYNVAAFDPINCQFFMYYRNGDWRTYDGDPSSPTYRQLLGSGDLGAEINIIDVAFKDGKYYGIQYNSNDLWEFTVSADGTSVTRTEVNTSLALVDDSGTTAYGASYSDIEGNIYVSENFSGNIYKLSFTDPTDVTVTLLSSEGPTADLNDGAACIYGLLNNCDLDGDGLPNHLDLDSDGDGCPDAVEGGGNYDNTMPPLVESNIDGGNTGDDYTGTEGPVTLNLGDTSSSNGLPTITADQNQSLGFSQNPAINGCSNGVDISLNKMVNNATPIVGDVVTFTIEVTNSGIQTATGVEIIDHLPTGYSNIQNISPTASVNGDDITWTNLTLISGETIMLSFEATVLDSGEYQNIVEVTALDQTDIDSTPNNDDGDQSEDDEANAITEPICTSINGTVSTNSIGESGVAVTMYADVNQNGIVDAGDIATSTVTTDSNGDYMFTDYALTIAEDFEGDVWSGTNNNAGALDWATEFWERDPGADNLNSSMDDFPSNVVAIQSDEYIQRTVDLAAFQEATLNFEYDGRSDQEAGDFLHAQYSIDGGATFVTLVTVEDDPGSPTPVSVDLPSEALQDGTIIRFKSETNAGEWFYLDNVEIVIETEYIIVSDDAFCTDANTLIPTEILVNNCGGNDFNCAFVETYAENDINQTPQNIPVDGDILTNDVDPQDDEQKVTEITYIDSNGDVQTVSVPQDGTDISISLGDGNGGTAGMLVINEDGEYTFTPATGYTGDVPSIDYEITDSTGATAMATLDIYVIPLDNPSTNQPPVANDDTFMVDQGEEDGGNVILPNDGDPDTDTSDLVLTEFSYIDMGGVVQTVSVPTDGSSTAPVTIYDENGIEAGTITFNNLGEFNFIPTATYVGEVPISYTIIDDANDDNIADNDDGLSATAELIITVVSNPDGDINTVFANDDATLGNQGEMQTVNLLENDLDIVDDFAITGIDTDGDGVVDTVPVAGTVYPISQDGEQIGTVTVDPVLGVIVFTPDADFVGTAPIVYTIEDDRGATDTATYYPTVLPTPVTEAENDINQTPQDIPVSGNVLTNDVDPHEDEQKVTEITYIDSNGDEQTVAVPQDGSDISITLGDGNGGVAGMLIINEDGEYTFTPATGYTGDVPSISYEITDSTGATATATLDIDVISTSNATDNDLPPVANDDTNTTEVDMAILNATLFDNDFEQEEENFTVTGLLADTNGDGMLESITVGQQSPVYDDNGDLAGQITVNTNGTYDFTPTPGYVGEVPIHYTIKDDDEGGTDSATLTITIVDDAVNNTFAQDDLSVNQVDSPQTIMVLSNDNDPDAGETQTITEIIIDQGDGNGPTAIMPIAGVPYDLYQDGELIGTLTVDPATGESVFDPIATFIGTAVIPYEVTDSNGSPATDNATMYFTTLPAEAILPIQLGIFTAEAVNTDALLVWTTLSESNNSHFEIEVSTTGLPNEFGDVAQVESKAVDGNSQSELTYTYTDKLAIAKGQQLYYRLKQVDLDGQYVYTPVRLVSFENVETTSLLYPNPVIAGESPIITSKEEITSLRVFKMNGELIEVQEGIGNKATSLSTVDLVKGIYIIVVNDTEHHKLIVQ